MFPFKTLLKVLFVLFLTATLSACGGEPLTFDQVPVPSDAQESTTTDPIITTMQDSMKQSMGDKVSKFESKTYTMPPSTEWTTIKGFYSDTLRSGDWKAEDQLAIDTDIMKIQGWTRGSFASEQALIVGYYPSLLGDESYLMVMLASE